MKTIVEINSTNYASTGNIMLNIAKKAREEGYKIYTCCKASKESFKYQYNDQIYIGSRIERVLSSYLAQLTGMHDHYNIIGTYLFIKKLKKIKPDLIHLHVMHDDFINIPMLFKHLKQTNVPIIWTFHDCCAFTGKCPYFTMANCNKWIEGCHECPQLNYLTKSYIDKTKTIWQERKELFTSINDLTIVTPSKWLSELVKKSFFKNNNIQVINNGINLDVFKPIESDFKKQYHINDKYLVLGVANVWSSTKGIEDFIELAKRLPNNYQIVIVGTNDDVDKLLPNNVISIHRTYNQEELVKIYSAADVFVNPTKQEVFGLVNIEALACGTPVITYNTGGCPEIIDSTCGYVIDNNVVLLLDIIQKVCESGNISKVDCINRSKTFDNNNMIKEYIYLYNQKFGN